MQTAQLLLSAAAASSIPFGVAQLIVFDQFRRCTAVNSVYDTDATYYMRGSRSRDVDRSLYARKNIIHVPHLAWNKV